MPQWYVSVEGQQHGPYSGEQLVEFTGTGNITRESMVWAEGMAEWLPAARIEGLFPAVSPVAATAPVPVRSAAPTARVMRPGPATAQRPSLPAAQAPHFPHPPIKAASFGLYGWFMAAAFGSPVLFILLTVIGANQEQVPPALPLLLVGLLVVGYACMMVACVLGYIILYRAWKCLSYASGTVTPGSAVGFLFIPFFNLYWLFRAYHGFATEWNLITSAYPDTRLAPKMPEGLFLAFCICIVSCIGIVAVPFLVFPVQASLCRAINFTASHRFHQHGAMRPR